MAYSIYQCSTCKAIITDSNCMMEREGDPNYRLFFWERLTVVAAKHVRLDSKIELSEIPLDCGCCRKEVYCDSVVSVSEYN